MPRKGGRKGKKGGRTRGGRRPRNRFARGGAHTATLTKTLICPDELDTKLRFRKIANRAGASTLLYDEFTPNGAYDVDPNVGSTETYGFDEYASLYSYYRVVGYSYSCTITNNDANSPIMVYCLNTNTQPSSSGNRWDMYSTNAYCSSKLVAAAGSYPSTHTFRGRMSVVKVLGSIAPETEDNYRALVTANPADLVWLSFASEATGAATSLDVTYDFKLTIKVRFYSREIDLTLPAMLKRVEARAKAREELNERKKQLLEKHPYMQLQSKTTFVLSGKTPLFESEKCVKEEGLKEVPEVEVQEADSTSSEEEESELEVVQEKKGKEKDKTLKVKVEVQQEEAVKNVPPKKKKCL